MKIFKEWLQMFQFFLFHIFNLSLSSAPASLEQDAPKNIKSCWYTIISFSLKTSGGQNSNLFLNVVHFFNASIN